MQKLFLPLAIVGALAVTACERTVVTPPNAAVVTTPPAAVVNNNPVPVPVPGPAGPQGPQGASGAPGKSGDTIVIAPGPAPSSPSETSKTN